MPRGVTVAGRLAALGFAYTGTAQRLLDDELGLDITGEDAEIVAALAAAPDPDLAVAGLAALAPDPDLHAALRSDEKLRAGLTAVLGTSQALADHLRRHRDDWRLLSDPAPTAPPTPPTTPPTAPDRNAHLLPAATAHAPRP